MSAAEQLADLEPALSETEQAVREDPEFGEVIGRIRARLANQQYDPERHNPHLARPRQKPSKPEVVRTNGDLADLIARFSERGPAPRPHMRVIPGAEREGVRRVREQ